MMDRAHHLRVVWLIALSLGMVACAPEFEPRSEVNYLRILAVSGSPPTLGPGETTTLEALAVDVDDVAIALTWEVCLFTEDAQSYNACPPTIDNPDSGQPPIPNILASGTGATLTWTYPTELETFRRQLCASAAATAEADLTTETLCESEQLPLTVRVQATRRDGVDQNGPVVALKTINLLLPDEGGQTRASRNDNPRLQDLRVDDLAGGEPVVAGLTYALTCELDVSSLETFVPEDTNEAREEDMLFSWFVIGGELDKGLTFFEDGVATLDEAQRNAVTVFGEVDTLTVWCVVRDGRGGTAWRHATWRVVAEGD